MQVWLVHVKIFASHVNNIWIYLRTINLDFRSVDPGELMGNCSSCQTNDAYTMDILRSHICIEIGSCEEIVPVPASQNLVLIGVVDRMNCLPFIKDQLSCSIRLLCDLDIII